MGRLSPRFTPALSHRSAFLQGRVAGSMGVIRRRISSKEAPLRVPCMGLF
jgi:hypothetical protein